MAGPFPNYVSHKEKRDEGGRKSRQLSPSFSRQKEKLHRQGPQESTSGMTRPPGEKRGVAQQEGRYHVRNRRRERGEGKKILPKAWEGKHAGFFTALRKEVPKTVPPHLPRTGGGGKGKRKKKGGGGRSGERKKKKSFSHFRF